MSQNPKYIDRFPDICAAGGDTNASEPINYVFKDYTENEIAQHAIERKKFQDKIKLNTSSSHRFDTKDVKSKTKDSAKKLIEIGLDKFRFKEFEEQFFEDLYYQSAKAGRLGQSAKLHSKPDTVNNFNRSFGKTTLPLDDVYKIIMPNKLPGDILRESKRGHENYILSHGSYNPAERISRYDRKIFNPSRTFGEIQDPDTSGKNVKTAMTDCSISRSCVINTTQDEILKRKHFQLGKSLQKQNLNFPEDKLYGHCKIVDKYPAKCLIHNLPPCPRLDKLLEAISYLYFERERLKKKQNFYFHEIRMSLKSLDTLNTKYLNWDIIFQVFYQNFVYLNKTKIKIVTEHFKITNSDGLVEYEEFLKLLQARYPLPQIGKLINLPIVDENTITTYREFATDLIRKATCNTVEPAGNLIKRYPKIPQNGCKADMESLCDETDVRTILSPSIPVQFGLSHRDYLLPRNRDEIKRIFGRFLYDTKPEQFDKIWNEAVTLWTCTDEKVSVEAFKCVFNKFIKENRMAESK